MGSYTQLYLHCVWSTAQRQPLITPDIEPHLYALIEAKCYMLNCACYAIGGTADHIHVLFRFPVTLPIAKIIGEIKGFSAHEINKTARSKASFKWQDGYGAFTLSKRSIESVRSYVLNQKSHHASQNLARELEDTTDSVV